MIKCVMSVQCAGMAVKERELLYPAVVGVGSASVTLGGREFTSMEAVVAVVEMFPAVSFDHR